MDEIFSWNQEMDRYVDNFVDELKRYGIGAMKYLPGNVSVWLPGGQEIDFIYTKAYDRGMVMTRFRCPSSRNKFGEQVLDFPQLLPVTMVLCNMSRDYLKGLADDYILRMAVFKEKMIDKARECLEESGAVALMVKYNMTPEELDFIDSFTL